MAYCPECDATRPKGAYCSECGSPLVQAARGESADSPASEDSTATAPSTDEPAVAEPDEEGTDYFAKGPIGFTFTYPVGDGWIPIIITGVLIFFSWLILPYFLIYGYCYRLGRAAIRGDEKPPQYDDWVQLFVDGILLFIAVLPLVVALMIIGGIPMIAAIETGSFALGALAVVLYLIGGYVGGGIVPTFMATGSVVETYRGLRFLEIVKTVSYLKAIVLIIVANALAWAVIAGLAFVLILTLIGILLVIPLYFVALPFVLYIPYLMFAYYYREALDRETVSPMDDRDRIAAEF